MVSSNIEDYLEQIYLFIQKNKRPIKTTELAKILNVNPSAITSMAKKLHSEGYVIYEPYVGILLTKKGEDVAKKTIRKHRIIETFLKDYLGVDKNIASEEACKMEHTVSEDTIDKLYNFMNKLRKEKEEQN
ncbi:metal-dependent transcriptional regulator [Methanothermococcus okinawensis]|uniref:Iron (Metal) dependent repressor, DtxR family n=1 Tax=Methanothermococcus okinawensis (strain DSM 14208 / JCM 11175 / IH1) TaxID=647113 RepID=F8AK87_METOI|nr:metal-dependent transcriptional regulator [Methanothermococcus okinawensis]AEH07460.1 iron (metal) dependent repressor, DtxR family [Methanothermococcus okinawensis IH1]